MMKFRGWASIPSKAASYLYRSGTQTSNGRPLLRQFGKYASRCVLLAASLTCIAFPSHAANPDLIPVANHTNFSGEALGKYLAETMPQNLKDEVSKRNLAVFALNETFPGRKACFASVGLTEATSENRNARIPYAVFTVFQTFTEKNWNQKTACGFESLERAIANMNSAPIEVVLDKIERTRSGASTRSVGPLRKELITLQALGIEDEEELATKIHEHKFSAAFDNRHVQTSVFAASTQFASGQLMCVAFVGVTASTPDEKNFRWPAVITSYVRLQTGGTKGDCKGIVAKQAIDELLAKPWTADGLLKSFALTREDGVPLPDAAKVAKIKAAMDRPKVASKPSKPPIRDVSHESCRPNGPTIQCRSQCTNGDCVVSYNNGCSLRVQVRPTFDPFSNQWKYPAPSC